MANCWGNEREYVARWGWGVLNIGLDWNNSYKGSGEFKGKEPIINKCLEKSSRS